MTEVVSESAGSSVEFDIHSQKKKYMSPFQIVVICSYEGTNFRGKKVFFFLKNVPFFFLRVYNTWYLHVYRNMQKYRYHS